MKLKSISISHMHQVTDTVTYDLKDITYFIGPNGAGKSTVLQAIQLALLGYIPGYDKTNAGVFKHSSDGNELEVTAILSEDDKLYSITRRWFKAGSTVKSELKCTPTDFIPESALGGIELPVFNFNEFKNMTANRLKEWFISFLPKDEFEVDWREYLLGELESRAALLPEGYLDEVLAYITEDLADYKGVDLVKQINAHFKEDQAFHKSQVNRLQDTINSMIYYSEIEDADEDEIHSKISEKRKLKDELTRYEIMQQADERVRNDLAALGDLADSVGNDPEYIALQEKATDIGMKLHETESAYSEKSIKYTQLASEMMQCNISSDVCPYTKTRCAEISAKMQEMSERKAAITSQMNALSPDLADLSKQLTDAKNQLGSIQFKMNELNEKYHLAAVLKNQLKSSEVIARPTTDSMDMIECDLKVLEQELIKIAANKQFKELNEKITKEKYRSENILEILKIWIKSTDANGLQTYMMDKPFAALAEDMSTYLSYMFGTDATAAFHLEEKANSFSFGMMQGNDYIEFDLLSSGEKCLFTIALILCLLNRSDAQLKMLLIDDILDHLDDKNAERLFNVIFDGVQCIFAGVKACNDKDICIEIGG